MSTYYRLCGTNNYLLNPLIYLTLVSLSRKSLLITESVMQHAYYCLRTIEWEHDVPYQGKKDLHKVSFTTCSSCTWVYFRVYIKSACKYCKSDIYFGWVRYTIFKSGCAAMSSSAQTSDKGFTTWTYDARIPHLTLLCDNLYSKERHAERDAVGSLFIKKWNSHIMAHFWTILLWHGVLNV